MVRPEPISPKRPEQNDEYKFELVKAMGVAIAAIAKEKSVFITDAEVKRNSDDYWELEIKAVVPKDKETGAKYNDEKTKYDEEYSNWVNERDCEIYKITEAQREKAEKEYYAFRKAENYVYPPTKSKEEFYKKEGENSQSQIIEVA